MTSIPRFEPLAVRLSAGQGGPLRDMRLSALPLRMIEALDQPLTRPLRRTKLWELSHHVHCSIVGTCLSTAELRQVLGKAGIATGSMTEHELHSQGVSSARQHDGAAKLLHKALDRKHRTMIARFDRVGAVEEVRSEWRQAVKQGNVPGGYWAAMTHAAANDSLVREIFGEVHMLSHLVGAANRADIRRLAELEAENDRMRIKLARQQDQLREGLLSRDAKIQELNGLLARRIADGPVNEQSDDAAALERVIASLERRLRSEGNRRAAVEERLAAADEELDHARERLAAVERHERVLREELEALEAGYGPKATSGGKAPASLAGLTLLYVGGRSDRLGRLRILSEQRGAQFIHHDGGIDDRSGLLAGLVSRAGVVMFPVDCVSHEAVIILKRLCRQMSKRYVPLRTSGAAPFIAALDKTM